MKVTMLAHSALTEGALALDLETPEDVLEFAARVCYASDDKMGTAPGFTYQRMREGHWDVIEHVSATFLIEGVSRTMTHQLVRHRLGSYSQESQRYTKLDKVRARGATYVLPPSIEKNIDALTLFDDLMTVLEEGYDQLVNLKIPKEDARFVLPNAGTTRIVVTMNLRSWFHFLELRMAKPAQWEIKEAANEIYQCLREVYPKTVEAWARLVLKEDGENLKEKASTV